MKTILIFGLLFSAISNLSGQHDSTLLQSYLDSARFHTNQNQILKAENHLAQLFEHYHRNDKAFDLIYLKALSLQAGVAGRKAEYNEAKNIITEAKDLYTSLEIIDTALLIDLMVKEGMSVYRRGKHNQSLKLATEAYKLSNTPSINAINLKIRSMSLIGLSHFRLYNTELAITTYEEQLKFIEANKGPDDPSLSVTLGNLANCYRDQRRYDKAILYINRTLQIQEKTLGKDNYNLNIIHYNLGINKESKGQIDQAISHFIESSRIIGLVNPDHLYLAENDLKIGSCYMNMGDYKKARAYFDKAKYIYEKRENEPDRSLAKLYQTYATLASKEKNHLLALHDIDMAISKGKAFLEPNHPWLAGYLSQKAEYQIGLKAFDQAEESIYKALNILGYNEQAFDAEAAYFKNHLYHKLAIAGYVHLSNYLHTGDTSQLPKAQKLYHHSLGVLNNLRQTMHEQSSKHSLAEQTIEVYEHALETAYYLYQETHRSDHLVHALQISEDSRRSTVLEAILSRPTDLFPQIPAKIFDREKALQKEISLIENKLNDYQIDPEKDRNNLKDGEKDLFTAKSHFYAFQDSLESNYPTYFLYRYSNNSINWIELQTGLEEKTILEFFDGKDFIYAFVLSKDHFSLHQYKNSNNLRQCIHNFKTYSQEADSILHQPDYALGQYKKTATQLYDYLLNPVIPKIKTNKILIIPDGIESQIVFDILLTRSIDETDPRKWPYLFKEKEIHYAQSIRAWQEQIKLDPKPQKKLAAYAPSYDEYDPAITDTLDQPVFALLMRDGSLNLPGALQEVKFIQDIIPGKSFIDQEASERNFVELVAPYQIIHLSAHAILDNENPEMSKFLLTPTNDQMYNNELTAAEICNLNLEAELAVLSACHTGRGKVNRGEGVMSLGRAFSFAGVPAVLMSLWKVPDAATSQWMPHFYRSLKTGISKPNALNQARLQYLKETTIDELCHPFYWGGFIIYGDEYPLKIVSNYQSAGWIFGGLFLLILAILGIRKWIGVVKS